MLAEMNERRAVARYPLMFQAEYRVFAKGHSILAGGARTLNISSQGLLLTPTTGISKGQMVEVSIQWHTARQGVPRMNLEIIGRVSRVDSRGTAVRILRYGFSPLAAPVQVSAEG